jgi:hypothetical protein
MYVEDSYGFHKNHSSKERDPKNDLHSLTAGKGFIAIGVPYVQQSQSASFLENKQAGFCTTNWNLSRYLTIQQKECYAFIL